MSAIRTNELTKRYGPQTVVSEIDLAVDRGEVYGFLGPNGAGKSTTIAMLLSYVHPTAGAARIFGKDVREDGVELKHRVGVLPEACRLYDRLSGRKHLSFAIDSTGSDDDPDELADRVGLETTAVRQPVGEYSTGMKQRLRLALALVGEPELLVLDEPSSGLDPAGIQLLRRLVLEERDRGTTVFFSSHLLEQVEAVCDRVGILVDGKLLTSGKLDELKSEIGPAVELAISVDATSSQLVADVESLEGVTACTVLNGRLEVSLSTDTSKAEVIQTVEAYTTIKDFTTEEPSLESLFEDCVTEANR
ncbi:ABC transporter ATP-binding protein [Natronococcus occultus]|nr:ABC transporter ATP-binding protein [Natronococcus occultus]